MAEDKLNQSQDQASEEIENPTEGMNEDDLDQVSGGMQEHISLAGKKMNTNLVNSDGVKKNQFGGKPVDQVPGEIKW